MKDLFRSKLAKETERQRQGLFFALMIFAVVGMSIATIQTSLAGTTADANFLQNVTAGSLSLDSAPSQINLAAGSPGSITNANTTTSGIVSNDTRGSLAGWAITGFFNTNLFSAADANLQIPITDMSWYPGTGNAVITPITGDAGGAVAGANGAFGGTASGNSKTLMNSNNSATNKGAGAYNMTNLLFNLSIPIATTPAADYKTNLRLTIA